MTVPLNALLRYWRAALLDGNRHIDPESLTLYPCGRGDLAAGRLGTELLEMLWREAEEGLSRKEREELKSINLLVAIQIVEPEHVHSAAYATMKRARVPLWLCVKTDREGRLFPSANPAERIIVDRAVLAPLASGTQTFTTVEAVDGYLDSNPPAAETPDWPAFWRYATDMFSGLFGGKPGDWVPARHADLGAFVACGSSPADTSGAIRKIYEFLIDREKDEPPPLLARLADPPPPRDVTTAEGGDATARRHLGQMGGDFPLNRSQRQSLGAVLAAGDGGIVAVNGPPGTGKTTFIQSVVASLWVESALQKNGEPPVILASSTNNKAITNILDTFARATLPETHPLSGSPLVERWLPGFDQYGLYLPSQREIEKGIRKEHAAAWSTRHGQPWSGLPGQMEAQSYVDAAMPHWLDRFAAWVGRKPANPAEAVETLRQALSAKAEALKAACRHRRDILALSPGGSFPARPDVERLRAEAGSDRRKLDSFRRDGHEALRLIQGSLIESLLSWLRPVKRRLWARAHAYLHDRGQADPAWNWETVLDASALRGWLANTVHARETAIAAKEKTVAGWERWIASLRPLLAGPVLDEIADAPDAADARLDTLVRPELFHLAARYWEGRWLIETAEALARNDNSFYGRNRDLCERRWRRFAKLTPCLVSTAYTAPRLFDYYNGDTQPLFGFIDLLIVDEAGQVPPQVGSALFAFARKALVVGDTQQLEPVWGIDADTDLGNLSQYGLDGEKSLLERGGMLASEGSLMAMAQTATSFAAPPHRGLFLEEHWRCRASVIAYCNELAYRGALKPMRPDSEYPLPPLGYAHVPGRATRSGLSWTNADEAAVIANWLLRRRDELIGHRRADKPGAGRLGDVVAVVTPFRAQIAVLRRALKNAGLDEENITVGTVHTLQGAERDVVLFSPVYGAGHSGSLFFDRGVSMLNVAVSRARESFLVFGDIRLFRPEQPSQPSGLLASYLFLAPENEITDIEPISPVVLKEEPSELERLNDLDTHRGVLRRAIGEAREQVLIVSPYLSNRAIEADDLAPLLKSRRDGPRIVVAYDHYLNTGRGGGMLPKAAAAIEMLQTTGVELWPLVGAHNKTLAVDENWIVEGSFNWLSAQRDRDDDFQRHEVSFLYRGKDAATHVDNAWREVEGLRKQRK
ncbi:MAG: AAA domain-containing protein [Shinella sp.]|nr:AAA domain-containing protein [Shinella sp.]